MSTDRVKPQQLVSGQDLDISSSTERSEVLSPPGYLPSLLQRDSSKSKEAGKQTLDKSLSFSASLKKKKGVCYVDIWVKQEGDKNGKLDVLSMITQCNFVVVCMALHKSIVFQLHC